MTYLSDIRGLISRINEKNFNTEITDQFLDIFHKINLSLFSGEFTEYIEAKSLLNECLDSINHFSKYDFLNDKEDNHSVKILLFRLNLIEYCFKEYQCLVTTIENKYSDKPVRFIFETIQKPNTKDDNLSLFIHNISVSRLDLNLYADEKVLSDLLYTKSEIDELKNVDLWLKELLIKKCNYLANKVKIALEKENTYHALFKQKLIVYDDESLKDTLDEFARSTFFANQTDKETIEQLKFKHSEILKKNNSCYSFEDYHIEIKYAKDFDNSIANIEKLLIRFGEEHIHFTQKQGFDKIAYYTTYNYIFNHKISLIANQFNISENKKALEEVTNVQNQTGIYSYFPFLKLSQSYKEIIQKQVNQPELNKDLIECLVSDFENCLNKLDESFIWSKRNLHWAFQTPYSESIKNIVNGNDSRTIFVTSSIAGIINYSKVGKQKNELEDYLRMLKIHLDTFSYKEQIEVSLKEDIQKAREETKVVAQDAQKRTIEILSIFSAIVLFASGSIQIFSKIDTLGQALLFMLTFASALSTFVLLIKLITAPTHIETTRGEKREWYGGIIILFANKSFLSFVIAAILIVSTWMLIDRSDIARTSLNNNSTITTKIDSVSIFKKDTISKNRSTKVDKVK